MKLRYRKIKMDEADEVFLLLKESAEWLKDKEIDYWQEWHSPPEPYKEWILEGIRKEELYFAFDDVNIVGMYRLQYEDEIFWGKRTDKAGYIHSLTTKREYSGKGIGTEILQDIEKELNDNGVVYLRLDCGSKVAGLRKYYEEYGFNAVGEVSLFGETLTLYEKEIVKTA
ncbi:MAG TPA: GNAT family N-acetyltransferase [Pseudobacteroides sp.]|nr:GNAT family N-acetyltransferase [Pseudobacteroides sp.]